MATLEVVSDGFQAQIDVHDPNPCVCTSMLHTRCRRACLRQGERGEGLTLADYGVDSYGNAFSVETGMYLPFSARVETAELTVQTLLCAEGLRRALPPMSLPRMQWRSRDSDSDKRPVSLDPGR